MSESMIDRVARAIMEMENPDAYDQYVDMARAAIEAMRVPTEEMSKRMWGSWVEDGNVDDVWRDGIDAALSTSEGKKT